MPGKTRSARVSLDISFGTRCRCFCPRVCGKKVSANYVALYHVHCVYTSNCHPAPTALTRSILLGKHHTHTHTPPPPPAIHVDIDDRPPPPFPLSLPLDSRLIHMFAHQSSVAYNEVLLNSINSTTPSLVSDPDDETGFSERNKGRKSQVASRRLQVAVHVSDTIEMEGA